MSTTLIEVNNNNNFNILFNNDKVDPNYILLELYRRVFLYNTKEARKLV
jgi:ATP-dependent Clp protease adapter protein ClpS